MPNHYKSQGNPPYCLDCPITPYTGSGSPVGAVAFQADSSMLTPTDPSQPCPTCPPPGSCCGNGGGGPPGRGPGGRGGPTAFVPA